MIKKEAVLAGQAVYSKSVLSIYDLWVLGFSNTFLWRCPTKKIGHEFTKHVTPNHLDVGVGTGYYLKHYLSGKTGRIALLDLNENSLHATAYAISTLNPEIYHRNILEPLNLDCHKFDSISINYLLHCLPGNLYEKSIIFEHLFENLNSGGILFGSTILGKDIPKNFFAKKIMSLYNDKGIFCNLDDNFKTLTNVLNTKLSHVHIKVVGCVALFSGIKK